MTRASPLGNRTAPAARVGQAGDVTETALSDIETCAECGFDSRRWNIHDADTLMGDLGFWWRHATRGLPDPVLAARPAEGVWSVLEYGLHSSLVTAINRAGIEMILAEDGVTLPDPPTLPDAGGSDALALDRAAVLADLDREGRALASVARQAPAQGWNHRGRLGPVELRAGWALLHAVHDATHHMMDVGRVLAALGAGMPHATGRVERVNVSAGGVPKEPVEGAEVGWTGLVGDAQRSRRHHGRAFQALCLWSSEVIADLASQGHPIGPGSAGENITVSGLDWGLLRPGTRLRIGSAVAEVSFPATPCANQRPWFSDGEYRRIDHDVDPARARWYAWVRQPGRVDTGDKVIVGP